MNMRLLLLLVSISFMTLPTHAGLPSSDKLKSLKSKVDKELEKYFQIQNSWGKCLEVTKGKAQTAGTLVHVSACNAGANQKWKLDGARVKLAGGKCLQPAGAPKNPGTRLQITNCNNKPIQNWRYEKGQLITPAGTCVEVLPADLNKNGGKVQIAKCNGSRHQQWQPL